MNSILNESLGVVTSLRKLSMRIVSIISRKIVENGFNFDNDEMIPVKIDDLMLSIDRIRLSLQITKHPLKDVLGKEIQKNDVSEQSFEFKKKMYLDTGHFYSFDRDENDRSHFVVRFRSSADIESSLKQYEDPRILFYHLYPKDEAPLMHELTHFMNAMRWPNMKNSGVYTSKSINLMNGLIDNMSISDANDLKVFYFFDESEINARVSEFHYAHTSEDSYFKENDYSSYISSMKRMRDDIENASYDRVSRFIDIGLTILDEFGEKANNVFHLKKGAPIEVNRKRILTVMKVRIKKMERKLNRIDKAHAAGNPIDTDPIQYIDEQAIAQMDTSKEKYNPELDNGGVPFPTLLFPGSFSPFTDGHYVLLLKNIVALRNQLNAPASNIKVVILMSSKDREGIKSKSVWKFVRRIYADDHRVNVVLCDESPISMAYKIVQEAYPGEKFALVASTKDDDSRVSSFVKSFSEGGKYHTEGVEVIDLKVDKQPYCYDNRFDEFNGKPVSASVVREDLRNCGFREFKTSFAFILKNTRTIDEKAIEQLWQALKKQVTSITKESEEKLKA